MDYTLLGVALAGAGAGAINAVAGGGTLVSYPALLWAGLDAISANTTSCLALLPGSLGGVAAYRRELGEQRHLLRLLALPALLGGLAGSWLLLSTSPGVFRRLVPFLVLGATLLMAFQDRLKPHQQMSRPGVVVFQLGIAVYGGFFGAGIGILMLAALGFLGVRDIHQANGLKNLLAFFINATSAVFFVAMGAIQWKWAGVLALGALLGGYGGAFLARRLDRRAARRMVVLIGLVMSLALFFT